MVENNIANMLQNIFAGLTYSDGCLPYPRGLRESCLNWNNKSYLSLGNVYQTLLFRFYDSNIKCYRFILWSLCSHVEREQSITEAFVGIILCIIYYHILHGNLCYTYHDRDDGKYNKCRWANCVNSTQW